MRPRVAHRKPTETAPSQEPVLRMILVVLPLPLHPVLPPPPRSLSVVPRSCRPILSRRVSGSVISVPPPRRRLLRGVLGVPPAVASLVVRSSSGRFARARISTRGRTLKGCLCVGLCAMSELRGVLGPMTSSCGKRRGGMTSSGAELRGEVGRGRGVRARWSTRTRESSALLRGWA